MNTCTICNTPFKTKIKIDNKWKSLCRRKVCIDCKPLKIVNLTNTKIVNGGISDADIARKYNISHSTVIKYKKLGFIIDGVLVKDTPKHSKYNIHEKYRWKEMQEYYDKTSLIDCAKKFNVSDDTIRRYAKMGFFILKNDEQRKTKWKEQAISNSINLIDTGEYLNLSENSIRRHMKKYLINKHGHKCDICNSCKWNNTDIPLICDHIDGNSKNNNIENFRLVCPNCDALLPTYKSKNIGKGREYDRLYRKKNKISDGQFSSTA